MMSYYGLNPYLKLKRANPSIRRLDTALQAETFSLLRLSPRVPALRHTSPSAWPTMSMTGAIPFNPSPALAVVLAFYQAWCNLDLDAAADLLCDEGLEYTIVPASLGIPAVRSKPEFYQLYDALYVRWIVSFSVGFLVVSRQVTVD